jgi:hypothetical protein
MLLPTDICYLIWEFIGNRAIIINKELIKILNDKKREFIEDPLIINYRLARFKESRSNMHTIYKRRPSILIEKKKEIKLNGNYKIENVDNIGKVIPSDKLLDEIIPLSSSKEINNYNMDYGYYFKVTYWELYKMTVIDIKRAKSYIMLF